MAAEQEFLSKELDLSEPSFFLVGEIRTHTYVYSMERKNICCVVYTYMGKFILFYYL